MSMEKYKLKQVKNPALVVLILGIAFLFKLIINFFQTETLPPTVYRIVYDNTWYPLNLYDKTEDISIFSEAIVQTIAAEQKLSMQVTAVESNDLLDGLDSGDYEGILSSQIFPEETDGVYISSHPYYLLGPVLVVPKSSSIKSLQDLSGKNIGVIAGYDYVNLFKKDRSINFVFYNDYHRDKLIEDVAKQNIDGMILKMIPAYEYTNSVFYKNQLQVISIPLNNEGLRLIMKNNAQSKKIINKFNAGLKAIKKNGTYNKLLLNWWLFDPDHPKFNLINANGEPRHK